MCFAIKPPQDHSSCPSWTMGKASISLRGTKLPADIFYRQCWAVATLSADTRDICRTNNIFHFLRNYVRYREQGLRLCCHHDNALHCSDYHHFHQKAIKTNSSEHNAANYFKVKYGMFSFSSSVYLLVPTFVSSIYLRLTLFLSYPDQKNKIYSQGQITFN